MTTDPATRGDASDEYDYPADLERSPARAAVLARWKHAAVAVVVGATSWALYRVDGGWSLDATAFALAAVAIVGYSLFTLRSDLE